MKKLVILFACLGLAGCCCKKKEGGSSPPAPVIQTVDVTVTDLQNAYKTNAEKASQEYKTKKIRLSGTVTKRKAPDRPCFELDNKILACWINSLGSVTLEKDRPVTLICGKNRGISKPEYVILEECKTE